MKTQRAGGVTGFGHGEKEEGGVVEMAVSREDCEDCKDLPEGEVTEGHDHRVVTEEVKEEAVEDKEEEVVEDTGVADRNSKNTDDDYIVIDRVEMVKFRDEVAKLCRNGKGRFEFKGMKISAELW